MRTISPAKTPKNPFKYGLRKCATRRRLTSAVVVTRYYGVRAHCGNDDGQEDDEIFCGELSGTGRSGYNIRSVTAGAVESVVVANAD